MPRHVAKAIAEGELDPISKLPFQVKDNLNQTFDSSYEPKSFKTDSNIKKLDLPAQKNILTNYFCFASLEAKRKFRTPRASPISSDLANSSSPTLPKQVSQGSFDCETNGLSRFSADEVVLGDVISPHNSMEVKRIEDLHSSFEGSGRQNSLEQSTYLIPKPCSLLRKGRNDEPGSIAAVEKTNLIDKNDTYCKKNNGTLRSSYILENSDGNDPLEKSKKAVVRSSYFKQKAKRATEIDENNKSSVIDLSGNGHIEGTIMKRKASPIDNYPQGHAEKKLARTERYPEATNVGTNLSTDTDKLAEIHPKEEKFGCKISHLRHYSDISGKSMDKIVSAISSYRFTTSGSRASGLRAPMRDVKNICSNRSEPPADIGNFSYVPKNRKVARAPPFKRR